MAAYAPLAGLPQAGAVTQQLNQNALAEYTRAAEEKQQTALLQQQTIAAQQQNAATQAVNQAYQGAFKKDPNTGQMTLDTDGLQQALAANHAGAAIPGIIKGITDYQNLKLDQQKKQQELQTGGADALGSLGYALQQANYDPQLAHTIIQDHLNDPALDPGHRQQLIAEQQAIAQNPQLIKQIADQWVAQSPAQQAKEVERQKAAADTTKAGAEQMKDRYKEVNGALYDLSGDQPKVVTPQGTDPAQWRQFVDQVVPPGGQYDALNGRTKAAVNFYLGQGNIKAAQDEIKAAGQQVGSVEKDIAVATNPQIQAGKVAIATAEGVARANTEAAAARGNDPAVADVPAHQVLPAKADFQKANSDYAQNQAVTQRLNAMMNAAKSGNVIAYQIIPEEGTLQITTSQGVHRINMAEIEQYAGGGSLWQRMQGHFGKQLTGASIPDSVLNDMAAIQKIQQEGSRSKYENTIKGINQAYGSKFQPVEMTTNTGMIRARDPQGKLHEAPAGTALPQGWKLEQ